MRKNIVLIGVGPHSKRIYLNYLKKRKLNLSLVIELKSKRKETIQYLKNNGFNKTKLFLISDKYKDYVHLPEYIEKALKNICQKLKITHFIISTEPKAHNMYIEFSLKNNINVLTDKPITVTKNMKKLSNIEKIRTQYYNLLKLEKKSNAKCYIMCQRQYNKGYEYVKELLRKIVSEYQIPITYIDIYHCDGAWEMPHDLLKENHPYKYGYGKLFHSGYHFIDLLSDFLKINNLLIDKNKNIKYGKMKSYSFFPNDELAVFSPSDYCRLFKNEEIPQYYKDNKIVNFNNFGEKNFYGLFKFTNKNGQTITNANLQLLHYGFSRRGWIKSKPYYKENGRVRHERINIQVGPLLNIQIHSYQSKEIKDRNLLEIEEQTGGLEHFYIDIYRNVDMIGGKPFERVKIGDLYSMKDKKDMLGYNELAREKFLNYFFSSKPVKGKLEKQALAIEILYSCAKSTIVNENDSKINVKCLDKIIDLIDLKRYAKKIYPKEEKEIIYIYETKNTEYTFGTITNYIKSKKLYEVYIYIRNDSNSIASCLLNRTFYNKIYANAYFLLLKSLVKLKKIYIIKKIVQK